MLYPFGMTYRIYPFENALHFEGLLDSAALCALLSRLEGQGRLVLSRGTEIDPDCLAAVRALKIEVVAESAYLAQWLRAGQ